MTAQRAADAAWLALVAATLGSWWLAEHHGAGVWTVTLVMSVAAFKVRLVLLHFMELNHAPRAWRLAFGAWTVASAGLIVAGWWAAAPLPPRDQPSALTSSGTALNRSASRP